MIISPKRNYHELPSIDNRFVENKEYFLLFESSLLSRNDFMSYIFWDPINIITINCRRDIEEAFQEIEKYSRTHYLAGYCAYELGYFLEESHPPPGEKSFPFLLFCVFDKVAWFDHRSGRNNFCRVKLPCVKNQKEHFTVRDPAFDLSEKDYTAKIRRLKRHIREGDIYQANFTSKYRFGFSGSAMALYQNLKKNQPVPYGAFCKIRNDHIISLSPELFFRKNDTRMYCRPMKGTLARGNDSIDDSMRMKKLRNSVKDQSENIMIVDLIRNDLGRISRGGSVRVPHVFEVEKYTTLFQMTSSVTSILRAHVTYFDIFKSLFPGGSVTGAPKVRAMQIIRRLENSPRGVYCGALGIIFPRRKAVFNLPIRTLYISGGRGEMGVGSGIVYDSHAGKEFRECILKADFLTRKHEDFALLETILWDKKYFFFTEHLRRLKDSAVYFGFVFNHSLIYAAMRKEADTFNPGQKRIIRLMLEGTGRIRISSYPLKGTGKVDKRVGISSHRIDSRNIFLYHKTTHRKRYESERARFLKKGFFDVIFTNEKGEATEGAISNIIIEKRGQFYTPPVSCGLLPGIYRDFFIRTARAKEKILHVKDLFAADRIFLCNSVRGLLPVRLVRHK